MSLGLNKPKPVGFLFIRSSETFRRPFSEHSNHAFGTHDDGFDGDLSVHFGDGAEFADAAFVGQQLDFENELVAGDDLAFEAGFVYSGKEEEFVFFAAAFAEDGKCAAGLRHGFDDEYAGHDGQVGEMALELRLVHGDVFNRGQGFHGLEGGDAVELQKRVAVGNEFLDVFGFDGELYVHVRRIPWYFRLAGRFHRGGFKTAGFAALSGFKAHPPCKPIVGLFVFFAVAQTVFQCFEAFVHFAQAVDVNGVARPFFMGGHREDAGEVFAAFGNAVGDGRAAADGGFVGDFDVSDRTDAAADDAVAADGNAA